MDGRSDSRKPRRRRRNTGASAAGAREQQLSESLREAETLLREVHHRVKNNLQIVASLLAMQADALNDTVVRKALSDAAMRISTIALIHAQLCEAPSGASVDMRAFVEELIANIRRTLTDPQSGVQTRLDVAPLTFPLHLATHCGLLISEIVTNAFQHAFRTRTRGAISISLTVARDEATLTIKDNGVGLPHDPRADAGTTGIGLRLVRLLATRQLRGRLSISSRKGTTVKVKFPLDGRRDD